MRRGILRAAECSESITHTHTHKYCEVSQCSLSLFQKHVQMHFYRIARQLLQFPQCSRNHLLFPCYWVSTLCAVCLMPY